MNPLYLRIFNNVVAAIMLLAISMFGCFILFFKNINLAIHGFDLDLENNAATDSGEEFKKKNL